MNKLAKILAAAAILAGGAVLRAQTPAFHFYGPIGRFLTPTSPSGNQNAVICFDNPADLGVSGTIYSLLGTKVTDLGSRADATSTGCPTKFPGQLKPQYLSWNGQANGSVVHGGVYLYVVIAGAKSYSGTLVVVR